MLGRDGEKYKPGDLQTSKFSVKTNRLLPAAMLWANGVSVKEIKEPVQKTWNGTILHR